MAHSLSSWLKDYLYISLGGNRKGKVRTYINLMITMTLGGLWHGAALRFILWGMIHGAALAVHKFFLTYLPWLTRKTGSEMGGLRRFVGIVLTFHLVCACWVLFRANSMATAGAVFRQVFTNFHPELWGQMVSGYRMVFLLIGVGYLTHFLPKRWDDRICGCVIGMNYLGQAVVLAAVIWLVVQVRSSEIVPFIYFQL